MNITNHLLTGAVIGLAVSEPLVGLPLAFSSHFLLDSFPHFGYPSKSVAVYSELLKHKLAYFEIFIDILMSSLISYLLIAHGDFYVMTAAFLAASPDLVWPPYWFFFERIGKKMPFTGMDKLHRAVQRYERPWWLSVEYSYTAAMLFILLDQLSSLWI